MSEAIGVGGTLRLRAGRDACRDHARSRWPNLTGTFEFSALPENPSVPHGAYTLTGTTTVASGEVTVTLVPGEWIERPGNYVMVGA